MGKNLDLEYLEIFYPKVPWAEMGKGRVWYCIYKSAKICACPVGSENPTGVICGCAVLFALCAMPYALSTLR